MYPSIHPNCQNVLISLMKESSWYHKRNTRNTFLSTNHSFFRILQKINCIDVKITKVIMKLFVFMSVSMNVTEVQSVYSTTPADWVSQSRRKSLNSNQIHPTLWWRGFVNTKITRKRREFPKFTRKEKPHDIDGWSKNICKTPNDYGKLNTNAFNL